MCERCNESQETFPTEYGNLCRDCEAITNDIRATQERDRELEDQYETTFWEYIEESETPFPISNPDECNRYGHWRDFAAAD